MVRRVAIVLGVALTVVLAALSIVVIGIRTKYPPVLNRVRRYARDVGNPRQLRSAGTPGAHASVLRHTGRKSGKQYQTPVTAMQTPNIQPCATMRGSGDRAASISEATRPKKITSGTK